MKDLKRKTIRGGFAKLFGQAVNFFLRIVYLVIMARLLDPKDFGLVAMVTAVTGLYGIFASAGLSVASIQKLRIVDQQISTLFWVNILVGTILAFLCLLTAPVLVRFYNEPQLFWLTAASAAGFIINAAAVQHSALLERQMRYVAVAGIATLSQLAGVVVGIVMAVVGFRYWAIVASPLVQSAISATSVWVVTGWLPGLPRRDDEIGSMLRNGIILTLNSVISYASYNLDKVLLGRFWGADILGLYGRAYQLINIPNDNLNSAIGGVVFSALSRLQNEPVRYRSYFLKGYSLANSLTFPTTIFCALFADDIILVLLGPKWTAAATIFRLLSPTVMIFGIINPMAWLLWSNGMYGRSFRIALVIAPLTITAYVVGLPFGASGVAFAYSVAMAIWLVPHILWCLHGTAVSPRDILLASSRPFLSAIVAAAFAFSAQLYLGEFAFPFLRLALGGGIMAVVYFFMLLFAMGQSTLYLDLLKGLRADSGSLDS
jgi:O-antigen/teichoic acid export membrane protein